MRKLNLNELNELNAVTTRFVEGLSDDEMSRLTPQSLSRLRDMAFLVAPAKFP